MVNASCPNCLELLQVDAEFAGKTVKCVLCGETFIAPDDDANSADTNDAIPFPVLLVILSGGHFVGLLLLAMMIGIGRSTAITVLIVVVEIAVWQRKRLVVWLQQVQESDTTRQLVERGREQVVNVLGPTSSSARSAARPMTTFEEPVGADIVDAQDDVLIEIQIGGSSASGRETIYSPWDSQRSRMSRGNGKPLNVDLPKDRVAFFGPGTSLDLGRGALTDPLVYATNAACGDTFGASLIDATLPVAPQNQSLVDDLPYWPSYYESSPEQRSRYLDWLAGGRRDPSIELGYVFIYFYGLERRVLIDGADHLPIIEEIVRLCSIYSHSNSFRNYSSSLLWLTIFLAGRQQPLSELFMSKALHAIERWNEDALGMCLAYYCLHSQALPHEVAFIVSQHDPRSRSSVIVKRHKDEFRELFCKKYQAKFGSGLMLRASKRPKKIAYRPASATLLRSTGYDDMRSLDTMPNVLAISSQFKPLLTIWDECIDDLRAYSRAHRASDGTEMTAEAYESLPAELRDGNHPEENTWMDLWQECADEDGWPLVPVSRLAELKGIAQRDRLTKTQSARILTTADALGIGLEPDARLTGRPYRWNERVSPFFLETDAPENMAVYHAAAVLLRLGVSISAADGQIDQDELALITSHLEAQFDLTANQSKRLEQLKYLLLHSEEADKTVSTILRKRLPHNHRLLVGKFLVGIAAADQIVTRDEIKALRAAYRALGLESIELDQLLAPYAASDTKTLESTTAELKPQQFRLDMKAVSSIMAETKEVAAILCNVLAEDDNTDEDSYEAQPVSSSEAAWQVASETSAATATLEPDAIKPEQTSGERLPGLDGLSSRFQPFLRSLIAKTRWTPEEATALAREHRVMLAGAVEEINEWSHEQFDDWLVEEDDGLVVQIGLIEGDT